MEDAGNTPSRARRRVGPAALSGSGALAEGRWLWRRLYTFLSSGGLWLLLWRLVESAPPAQVLELARGLMALLALLLVLYLVAPTAQQLANAFSLARPGGGRRA